MSPIQQNNVTQDGNGLTHPNLAQYPQTPTQSINSYQTPHTPQYQPIQQIQPMTNHTTISKSHFTGDIDHSSDMNAWYPDIGVTHHSTPHIQSISSP